ncbi:hypothetical protein GCM10011376_21830 [Nocardioides flavus (ex Wang et al. 2016)]|uniref:Uncharacterized protein n=1 Tax=Nocardioides flavus (ex Wang et al. 2016) TaxID=2058780 RepID=A0ABQ3HIT9_9ACTN|nr:hypothetical protein GCM10011376_21830 [Nocardioides flavus (ex Wang et al. 2016)]
MEMTIAHAKAAPRVMVKLAVWVMNPGPMALVAIRKTAPITAVRLKPDAPTGSVPAESLPVDLSAGVCWVIPGR